MMSPHPSDPVATLSGLQALGISLSVMGGAWLWTAWDYARNGRYLAPLRWYVVGAPPEEYDLQVLNREYSRHTGRPLRS